MMNKIIGYLSDNMFFIRLLLWFRGLLAENKIPDTLFNRLKNYYTSELSEPILDLEVINKHLENDMGYLNSKEEFKYIREISKMRSKQKAQGDIVQRSHPYTKRKYHSIKIISYRDTIELDAVIDREFVLDIKEEHLNDIFKVYKQKFKNDEKALYYRLRLSTLTSFFKS